MATIACNAIHCSVDVAAKYIANKEKLIPYEDIHNCLNYIGDGHGMSRHTYGFNGASSDVDFAMKQFMKCKEKYDKCHNKECRVITYKLDEYMKKNRKTILQLKKNKNNIIDEKNNEIKIVKQDVLAQHFYISMPDNIAIKHEELIDMTRELMKNENLKDNIAVAAAHYNTDNQHIHILVCNYNNDGTKKLSINNKKLCAIKAKLDHLCIERDIPIINDMQTRYYAGQEYCDWIDKLKEERPEMVMENNYGSYRNEKKTTKRDKEVLVDREHLSYDEKYYGLKTEVSNKKYDYIIDGRKIKNGTYATAKIALCATAVKCEYKYTYQHYQSMKDFENLIMAHDTFKKYNISSLKDADRIIYNFYNELNVCAKERDLYRDIQKNKDKLYESLIKNSWHPRKYERMNLDDWNDPMFIWAIKFVADKIIQICELINNIKNQIEDIQKAADIYKTMDEIIERVYSKKIDENEIKETKSELDIYIDRMAHEVHDEENSVNVTKRIINKDDDDGFERI